MENDTPMNRVSCNWAHWFQMLIFFLAPAYILLAEEEATTIIEAEKILKNALKVAEANYR